MGALTKRIRLLTDEGTIRYDGIRFPVSFASPRFLDTSSQLITSKLKKQFPEIYGVVPTAAIRDKRLEFTNWLIYIWPHALRQWDKWKPRSLQARISLERKESHDEEIPPQPLCGI
jgi:hypothetical protein